MLLDTDLEPKISDFVLARLLNPIGTHLSTCVIVEFGDVGNVALDYIELDCFPKGGCLQLWRCPPWVIYWWEDGKVTNVYYISRVSFHLVAGGMGHRTLTKLQVKSCHHKSLLGKGENHDLIRFLKLAYSCVSSNPKERPSIFEAYQLLRSIGKRYQFFSRCWNYVAKWYWRQWWRTETNCCSSWSKN